jgi:hypothetical protein
MATHVITISATTNVPFPLTISDDEGNTASTIEGDKGLTTTFKTGDIVMWKIDPKSNISSINGIDWPTVTFGGKTGKFPIFSKVPYPVNDGSGAWSAVIQMPPGASAAEAKYSILYTINNKAYTQDPRIRIKQ